MAAFHPKKNHSELDFDKMKLFLAIVYIILPLFINIIAKSYFGGSSYVSGGAHAYVSEIGICALMARKYFKGLYQRKIHVLLFLAFFSAFVADFIYSWTIDDPARLTLGIVYLSEASYLLFAIFLFQ